MRQPKRGGFFFIMSRGKGQRGGEKRRKLAERSGGEGWGPARLGSKARL